MTTLAERPTEDRTFMHLVLRDDIELPHIRDLLIAPLPDSDAECWVRWLKQQADAAWYQDPHRSLKYAELIIAIGTARSDLRQIALGTMTKGDAFRLLNRAREAWSLLDDAGRLFLEAGDNFGWARTRIGRLGMCSEIGAVAEALNDGARAREIFAQHNDHNMLLRLDLNTAVVHDLTGDHAQALQRYQEALAAAQALGQAGEAYLPILYTNMGYASNFLGDYRSALTYYQQAERLMLARGEISGIVNIQLALAYVALAQGRYRRALGLLHEVVDRAADQLPKEAALARREMVECYLQLNQFEQAHALAQRVIEDYRQAGADHDLGRTLLLFADACAALVHDENARTAIDEAAAIFAGIDARPWEAHAHLRRGQIALRQQAWDQARRAAQTAASIFEQADRRVDLAEALLLQAQVAYNVGEWQTASDAAMRALRLVDRQQTPYLCYRLNLLLGRAAREQGMTTRARRRFEIAVAIVERVQRHLTITLRADFLQTRGDALRELIGLHLRQGHTRAAFETLERAKSLSWLTYLTQRDELRWRMGDDRTRRLVEELNDLRTEHHGYMRMLSEDDGSYAPHLEVAEVRAKLAACETRIRQITERLYLDSAVADPSISPVPPTLTDIQAALSIDTVLIEYYVDEDQVWAFVIQSAQIDAVALPTDSVTLENHIERLQLNINRAVRLSANASAAQGQLTRLAQNIGAALHDALFAPLQDYLQAARCYIVPYGVLHYLPFHLLFDGAHYVIEQHEIVVLPSAALVTRSPVKRSGAPIIMADSWHGRLPHTEREADVIARLFAASMQPAHLGTPGKLLHIAAHGEYRIDQPDFSYVQLGDEPLFTDDLLQHDLSYELVTLSACETGRARVAPGEELIGLGRAFLYAGAGALIASLWRIEDEHTVTLMERLYTALLNGMTKSAALQSAQLSLLREQPNLHPAFWGAFILIGSTDALTADFVVEG